MASDKVDTKFTSAYVQPPALKHGPLTKVFDNVYTVQGTADMGGPMRITRVMTIVVDKNDDGEDELSLISAVRLDEGTLEKLEALGTIKNVVKIGHFHGSDDPFYIERYNAVTWALKGHKFRGGHKVDHVLKGGAEMPFSNASLYEFKYSGPKAAEAVIVLHDHDALIACDAIQNFRSTAGCSLVGGFMTNQLGFVYPMNIGPGWVAAAQMREDEDDRGGTIFEDFVAIEQLPWSNFISAHGTPVVDGTAKKGYSKSLHERWGPKKLDNTYKAMDVAMASMKRRLMTIIVPIIVLFFAFVVWYVRK